jgi:hypothetical protein
MTLEPLALLIGERSGDRLAERWDLRITAISVAEPPPSEQVSNALFRYFAEEVLHSSRPRADTDRRRRGGDGGRRSPHRIGGGAAAFAVTFAQTFAHLR